MISQQEWAVIQALVSKVAELEARIEQLEIMQGRAP